MEIDFVPYMYEFDTIEKKRILEYIDKELLLFLDKNKNKINNNSNNKEKNYKIEFIGSIQYLNLVKELNDYVRDKFKELKVTSTKFIFAKENSQILGCSYQTSLKNDTIYFVVGDGIFHPGALIYTKDKDKNIVLFDIFKPKFDVVNFINEYNKYLIKIDIMKNLFEKSENVGIFVSTKPGQSYISNSIKLKEKLEGMGKTVYLFIANNIDSNEFMNFNYIDYIINTACPRIFTDDFSNYNKIINYYEFIKFILL